MHSAVSFTVSPAHWLLALLSIVLVDIVLAGDNAIAIALAARTLPPQKRTLAITIGAGMAVVLRILLTFVAGRMLNLNYLKLAGGTGLLWIAVRLLLENTEEPGGRDHARSIWHAIGLITLADISMSLDNVLAVAGASQGSLPLLVFGLGLSIPLVVFASSLLSRLTEKYPALVYLGAAVLGKIGGEMIMTDGAVTAALHPSPLMAYATEVLLALAVSAGPWLFCRRGAGPAARPSR